MTIGRDELDRRFGYFPADTENKKEAHARVRNRFRELAYSIDEAMPDGREKSIAMTHIEDAMFWTNAAVARPAAPLPVTGSPRIAGGYPYP